MARFFPRFDAPAREKGIDLAEFFAARARDGKIESSKKMTLATILWRASARSK